MVIGLLKPNASMIGMRMGKYEELQQELQASLSQFRSRSIGALRIVSSIVSLLNEEMGFPKEAFMFRSDLNEPQDDAHPMADHKLDRRPDGSFCVTMDIRVDVPSEENRQIPIRLGEPRAGTCLTFVDLIIRFPSPNNNQVEVSLGVEPGK